MEVTDLLFGLALGIAAASATALVILATGLARADRMSRRRT